MKTKLEIQNKYGKHVTEKKLYCDGCIRLHNEILRMNMLYIQFRDCDSSYSIIENIEEARRLLILAFDESLIEIERKWKTEKDLVKKLKKSASRYFKFLMFSKKNNGLGNE